jgi:hypothetical protein
LREVPVSMEAMAVSAVVKAIHKIISADDLSRLQREQYRHDQRNHSDVICLAKPDRLKHYGLHFAKYVGRLARGDVEIHGIDRTITDTALICLSAANTLHQRLEQCIIGKSSAQAQSDQLRVFADAAGRFADACEKMDHLEEFISIARAANEDVLNWIVQAAEGRGLNLQAAIQKRRIELADRQFYVSD